ncbi:MAG: hypothetical protein L0H64_11040 [Pseudonocardia sp.]|nr:hypothetical protein [Pseudonocardia sp.]
MLAPSAPVRLEIPALGVQSGDLVPLGLQPDGSMAVPDAADTVGWCNGAPTPGALGPAVLAAHVDWKGEPGSSRPARARPGRRRACRAGRRQHRHVPG